MTKSLEERVEFLEQRVEKLEKQLANNNQRTHIQQPLPKPVHTQQKQQFPTVDKKKESIEWERVIFQKILPRVFIFILILGVLWGLKAAYDYGIITIQVILTLGILLAIAMAVIGARQIKKERKVLGQVLIGGALPVFMLTIFAMHQIYYMIGPGAAFTLNVAAIIIGIIFTFEFRSQSIGIVTLVAGVLVPYLIKQTMPNLALIISYEAILYLLFLSLALFLRFRALYYVSTLLLHVAIIGIHISFYIPKQLYFLTILPIVIQQFALLIGLLLTKISLKSQAYTLFGSLIATSIWLIALIETNQATTIFVLMILAQLVGFYFYQKDSDRAPIFIVNASMGLMMIAFLHEWEITFEIVMAIILVYLFYANRFHSKFHYVLASLQYIFAFFSLQNTSTIQDWISYDMLHHLVFIGVTAGGLYLIYRSTASDHVKKNVFNIGIPYVAFLLMAFSSQISRMIELKYLYYTQAPIILSGLWVLIAIGMMTFSKLTSINSGKFTGVAILFLTVAKIILFDIDFMSVTVRAILFIALGVIGLFISRIYYKKDQ